MTLAIYPGSFDPLTNGHIDIMRRGLSVFDRVVLAVANNQNKTPTFSVEQRLEMAKEVFKDEPRVEYDTFSGLLVDYAKAKGAKVLLRGLRAVSDFEYEFQLASMNRKLNDNVETVFMMTSEEHFYVSSSLVREVARYEGNVSAFVPQCVEKALLKHFSKSH